VVLVRSSRSMAFIVVAISATHKIDCTKRLIPPLAQRVEELGGQAFLHWRGTRSSGAAFGSSCRKFLFEGKSMTETHHAS
jgi:hypothetical protein